MGTKENHDTHFLKSEVSACEILSDFLITCRYVGADNVGAIKVNWSKSSQQLAYNKDPSLNSLIGNCCGSY